MLDNIYLAFISGYFFSRDHVPKVGKLLPEQLTFQRIQFKSSFLQFPEHSLHPLKVADQVLGEDYYII